MALKLMVPADVAEEVTEDGLAAWPLETRGDPGAIAIAVSLLGVTANLATVVASADTVRDIAHRVAIWALRRPPRPGPDAPVELEVALRDGGPGVRVIVRSPNESTAVIVLRDDLTRIVIDLAAQTGRSYG